MRVDGKAFRTIWVGADGDSIEIIDQTKLPHQFETVTLRRVEEAAHAIRDMLVRGAPLIGATAAYGMALAMRADASDAGVANAYGLLLGTRPTAVNLRWALDRVRGALVPLAPAARRDAAFRFAAAVAEEDVAINEAIGAHGLAMLSRLVAAKPRGETLNVLTHCNAGWLATVDWGTATAPIYKAHDAGMPVHVWVDETRPRNQGAALTAFELGHHGVPHTIVVDNSGGHLMQHGFVDVIIVGTDRTTASGDVCNKIGTYLKALAAKDNGIPFYVALPSPTIDFTISDGLREVPIEIRSADEVAWMRGRTADGRMERIRITPEGSPALNHAFDVTPGRLVTGLITERGIVDANREAIAAAFPERL